MVKGCLLVLAVGCSGKAKTPKDATPVAHVDAKPATIDAPAKPTTGDVRVRVEWPGVPVPARASTGKTACKTPRAPSVAPTTTWGVPNAVVIAPGVAAGEARVVLESCAVSPPVALAASLVVGSATASPATVAFSKRGTTDALDAVAASAPQPIALPYAGHEVSVPIDANGVYALDADGELAWIVAASGAITDASGVALIANLPPGETSLVAWLPPRAGQVGRVARGKATVVVGEIVDVTLDLTK